MSARRIERALNRADGHAEILYGDPTPAAAPAPSFESVAAEVVAQATAGSAQIVELVERQAQQEAAARDADLAVGDCVRWKFPLGDAESREVFTVTEVRNPRPELGDHAPARVEIELVCDLPLKPRRVAQADEVEAVLCVVCCNEGALFPAAPVRALIAMESLEEVAGSVAPVYPLDLDCVAKLVAAFGDRPAQKLRYAAEWSAEQGYTPRTTTGLAIDAFGPSQGFDPMDAVLIADLAAGESVQIEAGPLVTRSA